MNGTVTVRPLQETDLPEADRIFRLAFGTFLGLPDPMAFTGDAEMVKTRWRADPSAALGAFSGDTLVGCNFLARWGNFGTFGPLVVRPDFWDQGVAQKLLKETVELFSRWGIQQTGLFTFPNSTKHVGLYQKFGYWPQQLTPLMGKPVDGAAAERAPTFSTGSQEPRESCLAQCREAAETIFPGLDPTREIRAVLDQGLGDVVLLDDGSGLSGFAICHTGRGSEAGSDAAYVKFGAVRPGPGASENFARLLSSCEALAAARGAGQIMAGVNTARHDAYRQMLDNGYRTAMLGLAMQRPNHPGFNRPDCFVIDDWR